MQGCRAILRHRKHVDMIRRLILTAVGLVVLGLLGVALPPILTPNNINTVYEPTGATLQFAAERTVFAHAGACTTVTWNVEGIQTVTVDGKPQIGFGEDTICFLNFDNPPSLSVLHTDGVRQAVTLRVFFLTGNVLLWAGVVGSLWCLMTAWWLFQRQSVANVTRVIWLLASLLIVGFYLGLLPIVPAAVVALHWAWVLGGALWLANRQQGGPSPDAVRRYGLLTVVLMPVALLFSLPHGLFMSEVVWMGWLSGAVALLLYGGTLILAWQLRDGTPEAVQAQLGNAIAIAFGTGLTLALVEIGLRLTIGAGTAAASEPFDISVPRIEGGLYMRGDAEWTHNYPSNPRGYLDGDGAITYRTNATGFRDEPFTVERDSDVRRLALVGDSFAMGLGVHRPDTAATILEDTLRGVYDCPVEVYNFGVSGYNSPDYVRVVDEVVMDYQPDALLVWYFLNDVGIDKSAFFEEALLGERLYFPLGRVELRSVGLLSNWLQRFTQAERSIQGFNDSYRDDAMWGRVVSHLEMIAEDARAADIPYGLYVHPILFRLDASYPYAAIHQQVIAEAAAQGYFTADLLDPLRGQPYFDLWVHPVDSHPNEIAHRLTGEYAAAQLAVELGCTE
jgi:hypothetical protein